MLPTFADVIFPERVTQSFTYRVPPSWDNAVKIGHWVLAPFGRTARPGFVAALSDHPSDLGLSEQQIRELEDHLTAGSEFDVDPTLVALAQWMADYYISPIGVCFQLIHPPRLPFTAASRFRITTLGKQALERGRLSEFRKTILTALHQRPKGLTLATLKKLVPTASTIITQLKRQQWIEEVRTYRLAPMFEGASLQGEINTNGLDKNGSCKETESFVSPSWWGEFQDHLKHNTFGEYFIDSNGPPFSRFLLQSIRATHTQKRTVLVILPDIMQARCWAETLQAHLSVEVGLFHSGLSDSDRMKEWLAIARGRYQIVVGTRLSVFVPLPSLGLIVLCDEEDPSYKEEQSPYYHARDVARERARLSQAAFLLHSPHPSLETVHHFSSGTKSGTDDFFTARREPPVIHIVDHQQIPYGTIISLDMRQGMEQALSAGGGIVVFHNRKGFSSSLACRDCGLSVQCKPCHIPYRLLTVPPHLRCPYCGNTETVPIVCPACSGSHLDPSGLGTERLEQELHREFPHAKIGRMDRNNVPTESAARIFRDQFSRGTIHILIGTEMMFHGLPLSTVRFVGVPYADAGLHLPDFRSAERLFHHLQATVNLLTEDHEPGQVVIQTRLPSHHVMQAVGQQQPCLFYDHELAFRQAVGYPPFVHFIQMTVSGKDQALVQKAARECVQTLASQMAHQSSRNASQKGLDTTILGPIASRSLKYHRSYRETILLKAINLESARTAIRRTHETMASTKVYKGVQFGINMDPMEVL